MATPPLGSNAPYGKIMIGTKKAQTKPFWLAQGIQPVIDIENKWLVVGHVDELFMWVSATNVLVAAPWFAAHMLHNEIVAGRGTNILWCGWETEGKTNTVEGVVIDNGKITRLLAPLDGTTTTLSCTGTVFSADDYLRVGFEILQVVTTNANGYIVKRAQAGTQPAIHASNDVIYALSPLMQKNLIGIDSAHSKIATATTQLRNGLGDYTNNVIFTSVPVLFNDEVILDGFAYPPSEFAAVTANLANSLVVNANNISIYYSEPGLQAFRDYMANVVPKSIAVNVWDTHHCLGGEIHCGTATTRTLPVSPPWWQHSVVTNNWRNER